MSNIIQSLRALADFLEANQLTALTMCQVSSTSAMTIHISSAEEFAKVAPLLTGATRKEINGTTSDYLVLEKRFGPFCLDVWTRKEFAGQRRVEVREVEIFEYPDFVPGGPTRAVADADNCAKIGGAA